jgi:ABC-type long-subunit fatty acid transport system fused permease/ATPase subunit
MKKEVKCKGVTKNQIYINTGVFFLFALSALYLHIINIYFVPKIYTLYEEA